MGLDPACLPSLGAVGVLWASGGWGCGVPYMAPRGDAQGGAGRCGWEEEEGSGLLGCPE